ncbi:hypothetical protein LCGC14_0945910, partial [marine sediment metagenome]|nr:NAD-dependent epimerase/dehydratase family protein [Pricia sp.]
VFASSAAVYGKRAMYSQELISENVPLAPPNHYGIWKLAGEHLARFFHDNTGVSTICLRINTTYGKGRDKGKTSAPTNAMKAVAMGAVSGKIIPFEMPYQGKENYHFVEDIGSYFAECTLQDFEGFGAFNVKGKTIPIPEFLKIIEQEANTLDMGDFVQFSIADGADPNLFVSDLNHGKIDTAFKDLPLTSIADGVRKSLIAFRDMAEKGTLEFSSAAS